MIVKALSKSKGHEWLTKRQSGDSPVEEAHEIGSLPRGDFEGRVSELVTSLVELRSKVGQHPPKARDGAFDAQAAEIIHRTLGEDVSIRISADPDFWRYLALGPLFETVCWRHPSQHLDNFGLGKRWEALPERLWFRAHVSLDPRRQDPYELSRRGAVDFWRSGNIRHLFGASRPVARALVRFQYPKEGEFTSQGSYQPQTLSTAAIREIYKRLQHLNATIQFTMLGDNEALELIEQLSQGLSHTGSEAED